MKRNKFIDIMAGGVSGMCTLLLVLTIVSFVFMVTGKAVDINNILFTLINSSTEASITVSMYSIIIFSFLGAAIGFVIPRRSLVMNKKGSK